MPGGGGAQVAVPLASSVLPAVDAEPEPDRWGLEAAVDATLSSREKFGRMGALGSAAAAMAAAVLLVGFGIAVRLTPGERLPWLLCGASFVFAAAAAFAAEALRRRRHERARLHRALRERDLLFESVEITPTPYALYDRDNWLVAWNHSYAELYEPAFGRLKRPIRYPDLVREAARRTLPPEDVEPAVAESLALQARADRRAGRLILPRRSMAQGVQATDAKRRCGRLRLRRDRVEAARGATCRERGALSGAFRKPALRNMAHRRGGPPLYANPALTALLGLQARGAPTSGALRSLLEGISGAMLARREDASATGRFETMLQTASGDRRHVLVTSTPSIRARPADRVIATIVDITELKQAQARVEHLAMHDTLTGLGNRARFSAALKRAIELARERDGTVGLLAVDLDHFKEVNDRFGHAGGDALLCAAAARMRAVTGAHDLVCRLGGDEFAIIIENASPDVTDGIAARLLAVLTSPFDLERRHVASARVSASPCSPMTRKPQRRFSAMPTWRSTG